MTLAHTDLTVSSMSLRIVKYYLVHGIGYIGVCAACDQDICDDESTHWRVNFVLARSGLGQLRLHTTCRPKGSRLSHPRRDLGYWDWQGADRPANLPLI